MSRSEDVDWREMAVDPGGDAPASPTGSPGRAGAERQRRKALPGGRSRRTRLTFPEGAREAVAQWAIRRSRKRPERVDRNKRWIAAPARSTAPIEGASKGSDGRRQGRAGSQGQRTALISAFFSSDQQAIRLARRPEATRSRPDEPEANLCRPPVAGVAAEVRSPETERQQP